MQCLSIQTWGFGGFLRGSFLNPPESLGLFTVYCLAPRALCMFCIHDIKYKLISSWCRMFVWEREDSMFPNEKHERRKWKGETPEIVLLWKMSSCDTWHKFKMNTSGSLSFHELNEPALPALLSAMKPSFVILCNFLDNSLRNLLFVCLFFLNGSHIWNK